MRRRPVLAAIAATLASAPALARAQGTVRRIGVLMGYSEGDPGSADHVTALTQGLAELGWKLGVNIEVAWRWAAGDLAAFARYADELLALKPDVLLAQGTPSVEALKAKARGIPIVFVIVTDPVGQGMVASLAHPGGTITGFTDFEPAMAGKWMELLSKVTPKVTRAAVLFNPDTAPFAGLMVRAIEQVAPSFGVAAVPTPCRDDAGIEAAMAAYSGAVVLSDLFNIVHRGAIVAAAARHRLPVVYFNRTFTAAGGLMSYGVDYAGQLRRAAGYIDRLLKGASAADLPVQQPVQFDLSINLRTAKALGIELPPNMTAVAEEVIE